MENSNNDNLTLEDLLVVMQRRKQEVHEAALRYEAALTNIVETYGATFEHNNAWFQIRAMWRKKRNLPYYEPADRQVTYLCELPGPPASWLSKQSKEARRQKDAAAAQPAFASVAQNVAEADEPVVASQDAAPLEELPTESFTTVIE